MQIRCQQCQRPIGMSREQVLAALDTMAAEKLSHYDMHCPHCRRTSHVSQHDLSRLIPDWGKPKSEAVGGAEKAG
jgi:hypothetical protein